MSPAKINAYLSIPYRDHGRDKSGLDCWGLVRAVAAEVYKLPWLPSHSDIHPDDKSGLTLKHDEIKSQFVATKTPRAGDLIGAYIGARCVHIGIGIDMDGRLRVLHTNRGLGRPTVDGWRQFARGGQRIKWWRYAGP